MEINQKIHSIFLVMVISFIPLACKLFQPADFDMNEITVETKTPISPTNGDRIEYTPPPTVITSKPKLENGLDPTLTPVTGLEIELISEFEAATAVNSVNFSSNGNQLAIGSENAVYILDVDGGHILHTLDHLPGEVVTTHVAFSPDSTLLATSGGGTFDEPVIQIWDTNTWELLRSFEGPYDYINTIAFNPDGMLLAAGGGPQDNYVNLYDVQTGKLLNSLWHNRFVLSVAFNPVGNTLASAGGDTAVHIWDLENYEEIFTLTGSRDNISDLAWSNDGNRLAITSLDGVLRIWDPVLSQGMQELGDIGGESLISVDWMQEEGIIAAGGKLGTLYFWDQESGKPFMQIPHSHNDAIKNLKFNPKKRLLATGGADGIVKLWSVQ